jgi:Patatin-like phospholipase
MRAMKKIPYIYLLRVPILIATILLLFPPAALWQRSPLHPLFENLFCLDFLGTAITVMLAAVVSWSLLLTGRIIIFNGRERFGTAQWKKEAEANPKSGFWVMLLAFPISFGQFFRLEAFGLKVNGHLAKIFWWNLGAVAIGFAAAYVLAYFGLLVAVFIAPTQTQSLAVKFPAPGLFRRWLDQANKSSWISEARWAAIGNALAARVPMWLKAGYLDARPQLVGPPPQPNPGYGLPYPGHWLAFTFAAASGVVCYLIDVYKTTYLGEDTFLPALLFVLILLLATNWILSGMTFFFDRFRIPLLIPLAGLALLGTSSPSSDHYFEIKDAAAMNAVFPGEALEAQYQRRMEQCRQTPGVGKDVQQCAFARPFIVVATAGGGIQAASWTTQVLTGLEEESQKWGKGSFADSVILISSVSGGAAGSMFFLHQYGRPDATNLSTFKLKPENFDSLTQWASKSSLEDIAWALVYRDIPRILVPYGKSDQQRLLDRGRMLEVNWQQRANLYSRLSQWKTGVAEGWRPAAIFNSTIAETGEPLLFQTTEFRKKAPRKADGTPTTPERRSFYDLLQGADVPVVTAVRLAATFPYVTPAARPATVGPQFHLIDGGYYDNYGIASTVEWIDEALNDFMKNHTEITKDDPESGPQFLVLQIRSFPDDDRPSPRNRGWFFQAYAPLEGVMGARTTAQLVRDHDALLRLQRLWWGNTCKAPRIRFAGFKFTAPDAPLSWSMTKKQIKAVQEEWTNKILKDAYVYLPPRTANPLPDDLQQVRCMFEPTMHDVKGPTNKNCDELAKTKEPW